MFSTLIGVRPVAHAFDDLVVRLPDDVGVVAGQAHHHVRAAPSVERVGIRRSLEGVRSGRSNDIGGEDDGRPCGQGEQEPGG
jgi:hypothetical protein